MKTRHTYLTSIVLRTFALSCLLAFALLTTCAPYEGCDITPPEPQHGTLTIRLPQIEAQMNTRAGDCNTVSDAYDRLRTSTEYIDRVRIIIFAGGACEVNQLFERYSDGEENIAFTNPIEIQVSTGWKEIFVIANEHPEQSSRLEKIRSRQAIYDFTLPDLPDPLKNGDQFLTGSPVYQKFNDHIIVDENRIPPIGTWRLPMTGQAIAEVLESNLQGDATKHVDLMLHAATSRISLNFALSSQIPGDELYVQKVVLRNNMRSAYLWQRPNNPITGLPDPMQLGDTYDLEMDYKEQYPPYGKLLQGDEFILPRSDNHDNHLIVYENLASGMSDGTQLLITVFNKSKNQTSILSVYLNQDVNADPSTQLPEAVEINGTWWATRNVAAAGATTNTGRFTNHPTNAGGKFTWGMVSVTPNSAPLSWNSTHFNPCPAGYRLPTADIIYQSNGWVTQVRNASGVRGANGRMPNEFYDLINAKTVYQGVTVYNGGIWINSYMGVNVSGRIFGEGENQVFLPEVPGTILKSGSGTDFTVRGAYWTDVLTTSSMAVPVQIAPGNLDVSTGGNSTHYLLPYQAGGNQIQTQNNINNLQGVRFHGLPNNNGNYLGGVLSQLSVRCVYEGTPPWILNPSKPAIESEVILNNPSIPVALKGTFMIPRGHCFHINGRINNFTDKSHLKAQMEIKPREYKPLDKKEIGGNDNPWNPH